MIASRQWGKRGLDLMALLAAAPFVLPVVFVVALVVRLQIGSPVLFRQVRPGYKTVPFELLKFRTMSDARDSTGLLLPDELRLTRCGKLLRRLSLDELPQLWNVLRGDLSLVGPRPLLMQYLDRYNHEQARRHNVLPGITGWAQINGRNAVTWKQKFKLDVWYVDNWSVCLDIQILWLTAMKVIHREGISQQGQATMSEFMGNSNSGETPCEN